MLRIAFTIVIISIHAPPRGATSVVDALPVLTNFNSRPSARGDPTDFEGMQHTVISIHAPPRGATQKNLRKTLKRCYFNSRPSARGDKQPFRALRQRLDFNSRPSARGDSFCH